MSQGIFESNEIIQGAPVEVNAGASTIRVEGIRDSLPTQPDTYLTPITLSDQEFTTTTVTTLQSGFVSTDTEV